MKIKITESEKLEILKKHGSVINENTARNYSVTEIQNFLINKGYNIKADGVLGPQTINSYNDYLSKTKAPPVTQMREPNQNDLTQNQEIPTNVPIPEPEARIQEPELNFNKDGRLR